MKHRFIILLEPGLWIAEVGSTMVRNNARIFDSEADAEATLARARQHKPWPLVRLIRVDSSRRGYDNRPDDPTPEEIARIAAEIRAENPERGRTPVERCGIREIKLDRRRNGLNF